jgi:hypothetical protein
MTVSTAGRNLPIGAVVAAAGGAVAIVGSVLAWESVSLLGVNESDSGISSNPGKIIAVLGIVAIAFAIAWIQAVKTPAVPVIIVSGVVVLLLGVLNFFNISKDVNDANQIVAGAASVGIGLFIDIVAGVVMVVGGALGMMKKAV